MQRFESKRDLWIMCLLWLGVAFLVASTWPLLSNAHGHPQLWLILLINLSAAGFVIWLMFGTYYVVDGDQLLIRSGPFRWRIPCAAIVSITPTRNPLSSPAMSLQRLLIMRSDRRWGVMVSPEDRDGFVAALKVRNPGIQYPPDS